MIIIAFGANEDSAYGSPAQTFDRVCAAFSDYDIHILQKSSLWQTSPVGDNSGNGLFINAVLQVETKFSPNVLMQNLLQVEQEFGRKRTYQNAPRGIDLDLIVYNDVVMDHEALVLPHPRMHERGFVLRPLQEIAPRWCHPVLMTPVSDLIDDLPDAQTAYIYENTYVE